MSAETRTGLFWGRLSALGLSIGIVTAIIDQAHKWWMLEVYDIDEKDFVSVSPYLDLVMVWNRGISYGLFQQGDYGQYLLTAFAILAVIGLTIWLSHVTTKIGAVGIGLIIGGAIGNGIDRVIHGGVADFFSFHVGGFYWYVFNLADVAIVAGVVGLMYDSMFGSHKNVSKSQ